MSGSARNRLPAGQVVLILVVLLAIWLAFLYWPRRKDPVAVMTPVKAESKLQSVGLTDNPDWEGLPDLFAVWADQIPWINDSTCFAYWHPGANAYAYVFEVTRGREGIRFHRAAGPGTVLVPISAQGESLWLDVEELARYAEDRRAGSQTHPFVFPKRSDPPKPSISIPVIEPPRQPHATAKP